MKFVILGKNIEVTEGLKSAVEEKIGKLEKYFTPDTIANVHLMWTRKGIRLRLPFP